MVGLLLVVQKRVNVQKTVVEEVLVVEPVSGFRFQKRLTRKRDDVSRSHLDRFWFANHFWVPFSRRVALPNTVKETPKQKKIFLQFTTPRHF